MYLPARDCNPGAMALTGRFTTAGASAPTTYTGAALYSVSAPASSVYTLVFGNSAGNAPDTPRLARVISFNAWTTESAVGATHSARVKAASISNGVLTVTIETQTSAGTPGDLTGPQVHYAILVSDSEVVR